METEIIPEPDNKGKFRAISPGSFSEDRPNPTSLVRSLMEEMESLVKD